jgi:hypothetical protein
VVALLKTKIRKILGNEVQAETHGRFPWGGFKRKPETYVSGFLLKVVIDLPKRKDYFYDLKSNSFH